jgi:hypothetical protein
VQEHLAQLAVIEPVAGRRLGCAIPQPGGRIHRKNCAQLQSVQQYAECKNASIAIKKDLIDTITCLSENMTRRAINFDLDAADDSVTHHDAHASIFGQELHQALASSSRVDETARVLAISNEQCRNLRKSAVHNGGITIGEPHGFCRKTTTG